MFEVIFPPSKWFALIAFPSRLHSVRWHKLELNERNVTCNDYSELQFP